MLHCLANTSRFTIYPGLSIDWPNFLSIILSNNEIKSQKIDSKQHYKYITLTAKDVNQFLGRWRVKCSSTIARRGENNRRAFSIATALEGKTTTFLYNE